MDPIVLVGAGLAVVAVGSYAGTMIMLRYPGTRAWLQNQAIKGYNYLDLHKAEVPEQFVPLWDVAYKACDHAVDAFGDAKLTWGEVKTLGFDVIAAVNTVRKIVKA